MLCYRCGSYMPDGSGQCEACGEALPTRRPDDKPVLRVSGLRLPFPDGALLAGRYRLGEALGVGAAGWVVRAHDTRTQHRVALKVLAANLLQTERERQVFVRALRSYRQAPGPHCVPVLDEGREQQHLFYAMPELSGMSLRKLIDDRVRHRKLFEWPELRPLLQQLIAALQGLSTLRAHGALRPHNLVLADERLMMTGAPHWHGLPRRPFVVAQSAFAAQHYLAPEALRDHGDINPRADVYSITVMLTEMMTGLLMGRDPHVWRAAKAMLPPGLVVVLRRNAAAPLQARAVSPAHLLEELESAMGAGLATASTQPSTPLSWQQAQTVLIPRLGDRPPPPAAAPRIPHPLTTGVLIVGFVVSLLLWLHETGLLRMPGARRPAAPAVVQEDADGADDARP